MIQVPGCVTDNKWSIARHGYSRGLGFFEKVSHLAWYWQSCKLQSEFWDKRNRFPLIWGVIGFLKIDFSFFVSKISFLCFWDPLRGNKIKNRVTSIFCDHVSGHFSFNHLFISSLSSLIFFETLQRQTNIVIIILRIVIFFELRQ